MSELRKPYNHTTIQCMTNRSTKYSGQTPFKTKSFLNVHKLYMQSVTEHDRLDSFSF